MKSHQYWGTRPVVRLTTLAMASVLWMGAARAGTVYRDRPVSIPTPVAGTAPCFVNFIGYNINAGLIREVAVASYTKERWRGATGGGWITDTYTALRVSTVIGGVAYEVTTGDLKAQERAFLDLIKKECGPK